MRVLVVGSEGQLGTDICKAFDRGDVVRADIEGGDVHIDICDEASIAAVLGDAKPDAVINTAAFHDVPRCETEVDRAFRVNATAAKYLATACRDAGIRLLHISTDYVFGHGGERPYTEADLPAPLSVYGASKLAGEHLVAAYCPDHLILRTAGLYGHAPCRAKGGRNFVNMMLELARTRGKVRVVTDEVTTPTYTGALAKQVRVAVEKAEPGLYHATCGGGCAWYDFAKAIFEETNTQVEMEEAVVADFPSGVVRPNYSVLENAHFETQGLNGMPHWRDGLKAYFADAPAET